MQNLVTEMITTDKKLS